MAESVKVKLKAGDREIEIEGTRKDIDPVLERWWQSLPTSGNVAPGSGATEGGGTSRGATRSRTTSKPRRRDTSTDGASREPSFDPQPLVNSIREHKDFEMFESKVLHEKSAINKIKLVSWLADTYLTTGQIRSVLEGLGVKMGLPNVSNAMKAGLSDFLQDSQRSMGAVVKYKLTGKAIKAFAGWLNANNK